MRSDSAQQPLARIHRTNSSVLRARRLRVDVAGPVATTGRVEVEVVFLEPRIYVASTLEVCSRCTEVLHIGLVGCYASENAAAGGKSHFDRLGGPKGRGRVHRLC